ELDAWMQTETRFERPAVALDEASRRALERGRLGDRSATTELANLLDSPDAPTRREAARLLARLPGDELTRGRLDAAQRDSDGEVARGATIALARLGDGAAREAVRRTLGEACESGGELCARAALAAGGVAELARALDGVGDDRELEATLVHALGAS